MNLFICTTPLQSVIVKKIIETEKLERRSVEIFYECKGSDILKNNSFFADLSHISNQCTLHCDNLSFIQYYLFYRNKFKGKVYNNVYLSSIHSSHFHFILSFVRFNQLITFDDGTANIIDGSIYRRKTKVSFAKSFIYRLLGNKFSMQKVIQHIDFHYTIYPGFDNIHPKTVPIAIFDFINLISNNNEDSCHVILGTVFDEVTLPSSMPGYLENKMRDFINSLKVSNSDIYYIPHPRQMNNFDADINALDNSHIAEQHIASLLKKYKKLNVYGFASSTQFNILGAKERVDNYVLFSKKLKPIFCELEKMLINAGAVKLDVD